MEFDAKNSDESFRNKPLCGMTILYDFEKNQKDEALAFWNNGKIYKADDGDTYKANLVLLEPNLLKLRGYVCIPAFGKTQEWSRVDVKDYPFCGSWAFFYRV